MHNFTRALKVALAHRVNIAACVFTSAVIAVLWGGNLTAVFPVVEVIMNDHSLPDWIDLKIAEAQTRNRRFDPLARSARKAQDQQPRRNPQAGPRRNRSPRDRTDRPQKKGRRRLGTMSRSPKRRASTTISSISNRLTKASDENIAAKVCARNQ